MFNKQKNAGFTLLELLMVMAVIAILIGIVMPRGDPNALEQLRSTAQIVSTELSYGRSLAMANGSTYKFTFDIAQNNFTLTHIGADAALNNLPRTPFTSPNDTLTQHVVALKEFPRLGSVARIAAVVTSGGSPQNVSDLVFNQLGATARPQATVVWLAAGGGEHALYIPISIDPIIGRCEIGDCTLSAP
jgi:prepilin-type N-terminal cleavage/methylation domain-containing protein